MEQFKRGYYHWTYLHSAILFVLTLLGSPIFTVAPWFAAVVLAVWTLPAMGLLFALANQLLGDGVGRRWIHILSGSRTLGATVIWFTVARAAWVAPESVSLAGRWMLVGVLVAVEISDFFDGRIARRYGATEFGAVWDMENDSVFMLALAYGAWAIHGVHPLVLAIGLMRYVYFLALRVEGDPPHAGTGYKQFARTVAAVSAVGLIATYLPSLAGWMRIAIAAPVLVLQLLSFGWDARLQLRAGRLRIQTQLSRPL